MVVLQRRGFSESDHRKVLEGLPSSHIKKFHPFIGALPFALL